MKRACGDWLGAAAGCWLLGAEVSLVLPLRLTRLAQGGPRAKAEARLMVREKFEAHGSLLRDLRRGKLGKGAAATTAGAVRHYLVRVRANRMRLMGGA